MEYAEASKLYGLPIKAFFELKKDGLIDEPLSNSDRAFIVGLSEFSRKNKYLRMQLAMRTVKERESLMQTAELSKPERYMFNRFLNHFKKNDKTRIFVAQVVKETSIYYNIPDSELLLKTGYKMRKRARNTFYRNQPRKKHGDRKAQSQ